MLIKLAYAYDWVAEEHNSMKTGEYAMGNPKIKRSLLLSLFTVLFFCLPAFHILLAYILVPLGMIALFIVRLFVVPERYLLLIIPEAFLSIIALFLIGMVYVEINPWGADGMAGMVYIIPAYFLFWFYCFMLLASLIRAVIVALKTKEAAHAS